MNIPIANIKRGTIKQVTSGDSVVIQGRPRADGPPSERQLNLAFIKAPKLERRPVDSKSTTKDEPWAWEAREFLRKKLIGKEVFFTADKSPNATRESGFIFLGKDLNQSENIVESIVSEGLVTLRGDQKNPDFQALQKIEELAKAQGKGMHGSDNPQDHVRKIEWNSDRDVAKYNYQPVKAIIEHVRDGSTIRAFLMPEDNVYYYITLMISGIRCPGTKLDASGKPDPTSDDPLAEEAKCFVEALLLQRDIEIILESVNNNNFVGSIVHPNGNIAELLLKKGFAKCVDWSIQYVKSGAATLRAAEKFAKERKLKIWKDFVTSAPAVPIKDKEFTATVVEVINGDAMTVKLANGTVKKIFLSSVRPPKEKSGEDDKPVAPKPKGFRPLYDIPWMFEAREYLRKTLVGKKVNVTVDYIQPARDSLPEKHCCTVMLGKQNIAYELVVKGLATVVRYRQDDDQRSTHYDKLMEAEGKALKSGVGVHSKKDAPMQKVPNISADVAMAKLSLAGLQRHPRLEAVVEFVASGSRLRLFIPKDSRLLTFLLAGITCPRGSRPGINGGAFQEAEPFGEEALNFTKEKVLQREVTVNVESMDKAGNFIGWLWVDDENLSIALVRAGLAQVHSTAERSSEHKMSLKAAEEDAKSKRLCLWKDYVEAPKEEEHHEEEKVQERKVTLEKVVVTEITPEGHFYAQNSEQGPKLEALMEKIHQEFSSNPPLTGSYTPRRGDICAARFSQDKQWYRAKVEKVQGANVSILYIDYGNRETINSSSCATLASSFTADKPYATEYNLACVTLPSDPDYRELTIKALKEDILNKSIFLNVESRGAVPDVTIYDAQRNDIIKNLLSEGLLLVENKRDRRLQKLLTDYKAAQQVAKTNHYAIWEYGDITEDDAREFGAGR